MANRLDSLKGKKNLLAIYVTAGYPERDATPGICRALEEAGVDVIELGMPYSDPVADGPTIQEANQQALASGITTREVLRLASEARKIISLPIVLMGHLNPVLRYGVEAFAADAAAAGVDGLILPDLPLAVYEAEYRAIFMGHGLGMIFLVTEQTPDDRVRLLDAASDGYLYAVTSPSTTGGSVGPEVLEASLSRYRAMNLRNPVLAGFGITGNQQFQDVCRHVAGAVIGSAFLRALQDGSDSFEERSKQFVKRIK